MKWTRDRVFEESRKYDSRGKFYSGSGSAYEVARKNDWLDEMTWLKTIDLYESERYCVYVYIDEESKTAYVGLTQNKKERHKSHSTGIYRGEKSQSSVYNYFSGLNKEVPSPIYLEENLNAEQARNKEDYWLEQYRSKGYTLLNKGKTGKNSGSLGSCAKIWSKERVFEESKKYDSRNKFSVGSCSAYKVARKNSWLDEMTWLISQRESWSKERVFEESKKYDSRGKFQVRSKGAYKVARKNGWLDEMTWLIPQYESWDKERVFEESKKYDSRSKFNVGSRGAYEVARIHGWLDELYPKAS